MKALLVRVCIDQAFGGWNAPVDPHSGEFVYVPIAEDVGTHFHPGQRHGYDEVLPVLESFCRGCGRDLLADLHFPSALMHHPMHLDPDFDHLTYGDIGSHRGAGMKGMLEGDLIAFYGGFRPVRPCGHRLLYAMMGLYVVREVVSVDSVSPSRWSENAHTRKVQFGQSDIVVRGKPGVSGRLERCIPIGEWRDGAYRVCHDVLDAWGGLSVKDGFIQRSAVPPAFRDPERFYRWFLDRDIRLIARNN
jgi:hypothetical protein